MAKILPRISAAAVCVAAAMPAQALEFSIGDVYGSVISFFTVGATMRMEERDEDLIAKINLDPGLCTRTNWTTEGYRSTPEPVYPGAQGDDIGSTVTVPRIRT